MKQNDDQFVNEEKEKAAIAWENKMLAIFMPAVGAVALLFGLLGAILVIGSNLGIGIFLIILAVLGAGGLAYGVWAFIKRRSSKFKKEEKEPDEF